MTFIIGLLSFVLLLVCVALIFLVLIQLPKKDAGIGVAFGGAATDALFGAGSGTVLTKATKYAAVAFFALAVIIGALHSHSKKSSFGRDVEAQQSSQSAAPIAQPAAIPAGQAVPLMSQPAPTPASTSPESAETPPAPVEAPAK